MIRIYCKESGKSREILGDYNDLPLAVVCDLMATMAENRSQRTGIPAQRRRDYCDCSYWVVGKYTFFYWIVGADARGNIADWDDSVQAPRNAVTA